MEQSGRSEMATSATPSGGVTPQSCACGGNGGSGGEPSAPPAYIYAIGRIQARFPTLGVEKELAQVVGRSETAGQTDWQALHSVLAKRENRYLARRLCWVMTIEGLETYLLQPRNPDDLDLLIDSLRAGPRPTDVDVVIGLRGGIASPTMCNGLQVPIVGLEQLYSFDVDMLLKAIPRPQGIADDRFAAAAEEIFYRITQLADNAGATDEHRALNYLTVRYPGIYATAAEAHGRNAALTAVDVRPSPLSGVRKVVDVVFSFTNRATDMMEKFSVRVDVTEAFPFLVSKMAPYYDR